jgi:cell shape-determining protein MreC
MPRSILSAQRALPIVLVVTLAAALLPGGALGWVRPLTEIARLVLDPFTQIGNEISKWLRPPRTTLEGISLDADSLQHFQQQMVEYERLYIAEQARADELERQLQQLQNAPPDMPRYPVKLVLARVGLRSPLDAHGAVSLNRGSRDGVTPGTVAVHDHVHLVGWVTEVSHMNCVVSPMAGAATRAIQGAVLSRDREGAAVALAAAPRLALQGRGDGTLVGEPDKALIINPGDEVVLVDDDWPRAAQGLKIGVVESVESNERKPLRNTVIVRPKFQLSEVRMVVLRLDAAEASSTGSARP